MFGRLNLNLYLVSGVTRTSGGNTHLYQTGLKGPSPGSLRKKALATKWSLGR